MVVVAAVASGCGRAPVDADTAVVSSPPTATDEPAAIEPPSVLEGRRCGESGVEPTVLPPLLAKGMPELGRATLRAGEKSVIAGVTLRWNADAWIGSRGSGHRGGAIVIEIPQAEADGGPWGASVELEHLTERRSEIGPYLIDVNLSKTDPNQVEAVVRRSACPRSTVVDVIDGPRSLWVSSEAIRQHTFDVQGEMLRVLEFDIGDVPTIEISTLGYMQRFAATAGLKRRVRAPKHWVTVEEVVIDHGVHARVRIEPAKPSELAAAAPASGCGAVSSVRTVLPPTLAAGAPVVDDFHMQPDDDATTGRIALKLARDISEIGDFVTLQISGPEPISNSALMFSTSGNDSQVTWIGRHALHVAATDDGELHVRRLDVPCAGEVQLAEPEAPTYVWLSTLGVRSVAIGPSLRLTLHSDIPPTRQATTSASDALYTRAVMPNGIGDVISIGPWLLEIVDIVPTGDTRFEDGRWTTRATMPSIHVQVRFAPAS